MSDIARSLVRFLTPCTVGLGVSLLARFGIKDPTAVASVGSLVAMLYGSVLRLIEKKHPAVGKLLGAKGAPTYK